MKPQTLDAIDKADRSLKTALAISDLLSCAGNTETLDDTTHETGHILTRLISDAQDCIHSLYEDVVAKKK